MENISGWLLVYLIGSVPLLIFYSMGLSGWFFEYPKGLIVAILFVFLVPLLLLILRVPSAPTWNIVLLWVSGGLISLRILYAVLLMDGGLQRPEGLTLGAIVFVALAWAIAWTWYFRVSERVEQIFYQG